EARNAIRLGRVSDDRVRSGHGDARRDSAPGCGARWIDGGERMSEKLRVVVVDDERPARSFLTSMLRGFEDIELVGEAVSGRDAVALIEREAPDLALLDLQMPELDGLGVVRSLRGKRLAPLIAFVTAY